MPSYFAVRRVGGSPAKNVVPDYQSNPFRVIHFTHFQATLFGVVGKYIFKSRAQAHAVAERLNKKEVDNV